MKNKNLLVFIVYLFTFFDCTSQSIESIFSSKKNCIEIELVALDVIPGFYDRNQLDSIEIILDFVAFKCIESPSLRLTRFLLLIDQHRFTDTILTPLDLYYIKKESQYLQKGQLYDFFYMQFAQYAAVAGNEGNVFWQRPDIERKYMLMLSKWTNKLDERSDNDLLESAVISHLQPNGTGQQREGLWGLSARKNGYLSLPSVYDKYHRDYVILRSWQFTIGAGLFGTTGNLNAIMGTRNGFMFSLGKNIGHPKNRIDFGGNFTFGQSRQPYQIVTPDTSFIANNGYGSFAYLDFVRTIWRPNRFLEWNISLGAGIVEKGIYKAAIEDETLENEPAEIQNNKMGKAFIVKPAIFAGSEFKFFIASGVAFNIQARYGLFNLGNIGGTNFDGNAFTLNAGFSFHFGGHPSNGRSLFLGSL